MNRIQLPNGQPAVPQVDGVQLACAMLLNGRAEHLPAEEQAKDIIDRIEALLGEIGRRQQEKHNGQ